MKRTLQILAVIFLAGFGIYAGSRYLDPEQAALNCPEIQRCLRQGYEIQSCTQQPIYYFVQPTGVYEWGYVNTELRGDPTVLPPLSITCDITAREKHGRVFFWEKANHVHLGQ